MFVMFDLLESFAAQEIAMTERKYSVQEMADYCEVDPVTIRRWCKEGKLFPGAKRKNPLSAKSHWIIPQSAKDYYDNLQANSEK